MNVKKYYFPGCRLKNAFPEASRRLALYMEQVHGLKAQGCCKTDYPLLVEENTAAVVICNNCIHDISERVENCTFEYVLDYINNDPDFAYPDYAGREFVLQDCGYGYDDHEADPVVRELLAKMHVKVKELSPEARPYAGISHKEHSALVAKNANGFAETDVVCYCGICRLAMSKAGKNSRHIVELLFMRPDEI